MFVNSGKLSEGRFDQISERQGGVFSEGMDSVLKLKRSKLSRWSDVASNSSNSRWEKLRK